MVYQYLPLDASRREVRLVHLYPFVKFSDPIQCKIVAVSLDDSPEYDAMSYCWGEQSNPVSIKIDDSHLPITANLYEGLRRLRLKKPNGRVLWIDAICINQKSIPERNQQVAIMRDIYQQAGVTFIWLGEAAENSSLAIGLMKKWATFNGEPPESLEQANAFCEKFPAAFKRQSWQALEPFFRRPWWQRVWVIQEYVLAQDVYFLCGPDMIAASSMITTKYLCYWVLMAPLHAVQVFGERVGIILEMLGKLPAEFDVMTELRRQHRQAERTGNNFEVDDVLSIMKQTSSSQATDPRDKIYALLGLAIKKFESLKPDYGKSIAEVYIDFTKMSLSEDGSRILSMAGMGTPSDSPLDLPSWVPDFRSSSFAKTAASYKCSASKSTTPTFEFSSNTILKAQGIASDTIAHCEFTRTHAHSIATMQILLQMALLSERQKYPTGIPWIQALFRTSLYYSATSIYVASELAEKDKGPLLDCIIGFLGYLAIGIVDADSIKDTPLVYNLIMETNARLSELGDIMQKVVELAAGEGDEDWIKRVFDLPDDFGQGSWNLGDEASITARMHRYRTACHLDRHSVNVVLTSKGYIGVAPMNSKAGDEICVLFGCSSPMVIRREREKTLLVGSCFTYGMMDGEIIDELEAGRLQVETFEIT